MIEHNKNFYSLEELKRTRDNLKGYLDNEEVYYFAGSIRYAWDEIERLNNIINELEKYCNEEIEDYDKHINSKFITDIAREQYEGEKVCFEDMLGKLQELKGSDKE